MHQQIVQSFKEYLQVMGTLDLKESRKVRKWLKDL